ncbi:uncharacterized protein PHALS_12196 [Plasmopara halstedii]|uniref:Uncharacterized protein n=1 Tax=Plasmopara halstedii TaxID=4781 RepID=A0A0P1ALU0_PLAHL|nr:uncharacterized protein PHALS_12196 [Plasmopara halstedii]CEG41881.1 hypothetical protein PHALS_12196 [Plasmopara halstedii]|eukprot:XP_024578250.1 hypothetical protein PHALS_12196 [Plasmopara halstedii]
MASADVLSNSYILLTPTAASNRQRSALAEPASDLLARKWAAAAKRKASIECMALHELDADNGSDRTYSRSTADRSSETGNDETTSTDGNDADGLEATEEKKQNEEEDHNRDSEIIPTYVCKIHDPKAVLVAEQIACHRVDIVPCDTSHGYTETILFQYKISVGRANQMFKCLPSKALKVLKNLLKDKKCADQLQFVEMHRLKGGLIGSLRRFCMSPSQLSTEVRNVLEAISDIDAVLNNSIYLNLVGAKKGSLLSREIDNLLKSHHQDSGIQSLCMCDTYYKSVQRYGEFYRELAAMSNDQYRQSTVASETLMRSRGVLSFYTDTIYTLDKREFRATRGLKQCNVYGFSRRKLFEIVRVSRKLWSVRHVEYGEIYTLLLTKYASSVHHMVAVRRMVPDIKNGGLRQENVCFIKKSRSQGYRCILNSEVISQGKVTTSISMEKPKSPPGDPNFHYMTMSEVSGPSRASICSSTLSVPSEHHTHLQRLIVSGGSDVVTYLTLAASYDILVGALSFWMERKY